MMRLSTQLHEEFSQLSPTKVIFSRLRFSEVTVDEVLICAERRVMYFHPRINYLEIVSKLFVKGLRDIANTLAWPPAFLDLRASENLSSKARLTDSLPLI